MPRHAGGRARMPRRTRATALAAVAAACVLALPLAVSCAGQDDGRRHASTGPDDLRPVFAPEGRNPEKGASEERAAASGERAAERRDSGDGATPRGRRSRTRRRRARICRPPCAAAPPCPRRTAWRRRRAWRCGGGRVGADLLPQHHRRAPGRGPVPARPGRAQCAQPVRGGGRGRPVPVRDAARAPEGRAPAVHGGRGVRPHTGGAEEGRLLLRAGSNSPAGKDR